MASRRGITLIALVITIVILIILATVAINMAFGDNGLVKYAESASDYAANDEAATSGMINSAVSYIGGIASDIEKSGGNFNKAKGVNSPRLSNNMKLVVFDQNTNTWIEDITKDAYSYVDTSIEGNTNESEWANAEVIVDGITSYFVWIPRYAYKITYYTSEDKTEISETPTAYGTIDVKFIEGTGKTAVDGTICKYASEKPTADDYIVHPAFTKNANYGGGWDNELPGIWIGKYEASLANKNDGSNIIPNDSIANILLSNNTDKTIVTKPGYRSWTYCTIGNMYTNSLEYDPNLKSHMLKNSEWGAVAYLSYSQYGRNGTEIEQDQNGQYLTGGGEGNTYITLTNLSSTGNVYGIYGLSGSTLEFVASYLKDEDFSVAESTFTTGLSNEYSTAYDNDNEKNGYKYGDATYETSGWNQDHASFIKSAYGPFFIRGGNSYTVTNESGIFYFSDSKGESLGSGSFRLALVI